MYKNILMAILLTCCSSVACKQEAQAYCPRCVEARANNAANPNPYFYYEDYQTAKQSQTQPSAQSAQRR